MCASCPSGFTQVIPGSCFMTSASNYYFTTGDDYCQTLGARSMTINSADEEYTIRSEKFRINICVNPSVNQTLIDNLLGTDQIF